MDIRFSSMRIASNPRGKVVIAQRVPQGTPVMYSDWEIRQQPVAVLKNSQGKIVDVVSVYNRNNQWMTDELEITGAQG